MGLLGPDHVSSTEGQRSGSANGAGNRGLSSHCRVDKTYKADVKIITLNTVTRATVPRSRSAHSHGEGGAPEDVKIMVEIFQAEKGVQANRA